MSTPLIEENDQIRARVEHLDALRKLVGNVYPNKFERSRVTGDEDSVTAIVENESITSHVPQLELGQRPTPDQLAEANEGLKKFEVRVSGRIATPPRVMGKAAFVHLSDGISRLQVYLRKEEVKAIHNDDGAPVEEGWEVFQLLDHGDFIGVEGFLFVTKTGELSIHVRGFQFLSKALLPMPDKMHGISDPEIRQRQRYADLIAGSLKVEQEEDELTPREVFQRRSRVISEMRRYLDGKGYIEVETPMLTPKATGAAARPFKTHHNALDIALYARIAPELYLKRLVVGGFEKVYELNRNFRNEGIDRTHNPEFTMLEIYSAYMNADGMMDLCENMLKLISRKVTGQMVMPFGRQTIDYSGSFERLTMKQSIEKYWPDAWRILDGEKVTLDWLDDSKQVRDLSRLVRLQFPEHFIDPDRIPYVISGHTSQSRKQIDASGEAVDIHSLWKSIKKNEKELEPNDDIAAMDRRIAELFEAVVETHLKQPTFITNFPRTVSPLAKASPEDARIAERFELYVGGIEIANGFSELNDPLEQKTRFEEQVQQREKGDEEAMHLDEDYLHALSYGMPPAAGVGIGVDRFVMLMTNCRSIRDVILFPHMRPQSQKND